MNNFWLKRKKNILSLEEQSVLETAFFEFWKNNPGQKKEFYEKVFYSIIKRNLSLIRKNKFITTEFCKNWIFHWSISCQSASLNTNFLTFLDSIEILMDIKF